MDHSGHDHAAHAHAMEGHEGHHMPGMDGPAKCSMNMLFTWDYQNVCVVFRQWQITSPLSLVVTLAAIVALVAGYEALREGIRRYETSVSQRVETSPRGILDGDDDHPETVAETTPFFLRPGQNKSEVARRAHVVKSVLYGLQNFYAFMIMLIFMTYNGWIMIAVSVGAGLGYLLFGSRTTAVKDTACH
ncbi:ctr copper transporter family protein [Schizothecium vesticola]|uniref:Copper transport protein n=1 Tax=Schizothecium vesticola TaxID=314040 RepID=A0AA40EW05_9PEZI|nr:ctr copper transporter family protein [Schizothecium vesticola]